MLKKQSIQFKILLLSLLLLASKETTNLTITTTKNIKIPVINLLIKVCCPFLISSSFWLVKALTKSTIPKITNITGIVLTKLDGTAKGGIVLAIKESVNVPVKYIGLGETKDDLQVFDIEKYIYGLFKDMM